MAAEWWWPSLAAWLGSEAAWFLVLNAVVGAIAVLSSRARPTASPRSGGGVTRRASSVLLQRLRSLSIFSYPSACLDTPTLLQPIDAHTAAQATEEPVTQPRMAMPSPRELVPTSQPAPAAEEEEEEDPSAMSMEDAYALILASRRPPEPERRSDVDAKAEEFKENQRQQRLNSISNYTQMLKRQAAASSGRRRRPDVPLIADD